MRFIIFAIYLIILFAVKHYGEIDIVKPMAAIGIVFSGWMFAVFFAAALFPDKDWK